MQVVIKDSHHDEFEMAQIGLVNYFRLMATHFYNDDYQPFSVFTKGLVYKPIQSLPSHEKGVTQHVSEWLLSQHILEWAHYKTSSAATTLVGRAETGKLGIIRIPYYFADPEAHRRIDDPAMLQPFPNGVFPYKEGTNIEILPFVKIIGRNDLFGADHSLLSRAHILTGMYAIAGLYCRDGIKDDLGLLPDGTPIPADPDGLKFASAWPSPAENIRQREKVLSVYPYMTPVAWVKDGKPKQDFFFGNDYLSTPLRPRPHLVENTLDEGPRP